jgi:hypothetical protein
MTSAVMAKDHRLISTPVSMADGFKRADNGTWVVLVIAAVVAVVIVVAIGYFVETPKIRWPSSPKPAAATQAAPAPEAAPSDEPRTYDVAPRGTAPKPGTH